MQIDSGLATLIAAIVAAVLSGLTLIQNRNKETRDANRKYLETFLEDLASSIYQLIALSDIMTKNATSESLENTIEKSIEPKTKLKEIRRKIKYPLWGIDDSIQKLTRVTDFTLYTLKNPIVAKENVYRAKLLGKSIDRCIKNCYAYGRTPTLFERVFINYRTWRFLRVRNNFRKEHIALGIQVTNEEIE
jgi:hypothetical protein